MVRKSLNAIRGIKGTTQIDTKNSNYQGERIPTESKSKIEKCLHCTKPVEKCKGSCYGRY